jgi:hypothetical protein
MADILYHYKICGSVKLGLKPEYIEKARKIIQQKAVDVGSIEKLRDRLGF